MFIFCFSSVASFLVSVSMCFSPVVFPHVYILLSLSSKCLTLRFIIFLSPSVLFHVSILLLFFGKLFFCSFITFSFLSISFHVCIVLFVQCVCLMALLKYH